MFHKLLKVLQPDFVWCYIVMSHLSSMLKVVIVVFSVRVTVRVSYILWSDELCAVKLGMFMHQRKPEWCIKCDLAFSDKGQREGSYPCVSPFCISWTTCFHLPQLIYRGKSVRIFSCFLQISFAWVAHSGFRLWPYFTSSGSSLAFSGLVVSVLLTASLPMAIMITPSVFVSTWEDYWRGIVTVCLSWVDTHGTKYGGDLKRHRRTLQKWLQQCGDLCRWQSTNALIFHIPLHPPHSVCGPLVVWLSDRVDHGCGWIWGVLTSSVGNCLWYWNRKKKK